MIYRATKQIQPATDKYPAKYLSRIMQSKQDINNAIADGYSVFIVDDDNKERLIASPERGLIEQPAFKSNVHYINLKPDDLRQALNIILGGDVNGDPK